MKFITLDFETYYGDGYSLSLKDVTTESYIRDPQFLVHGMGVKIGSSPSRWIPKDKIPAALKVLDLPNNAMVGHNLQFDGSILGWHYGVYPKVYIDTLALSRALVGPHTIRHGLKYVAELLCNMTKMDELSKSYNLRVLPQHVMERLIDYCIGAPRWVEGNPEGKTTFAQGGHWEAGDTELTWAVLQKLLPHFPKAELHSLDWTIRAFTDPKLYLDTDRLAAYREELKQTKIDVLKAAGLDDRKVLMSNQKFAEALEYYGVDVPTKVNAKGKVTFAFAKTDQGLKDLLEHENPDVQALVAARLEHKSTIEETRSALYHAASVRGAWPVGYNYAGAQVTQRYSGNKGGGGNPQNLKRGGTLRKCIYAPEPYLLGVADLSQIEARITLWLGMQITGADGEEAKALQVMAEGGDIYGWFGTRIYGKIINKEETPVERQISKSAVLGLGFGMGAGRFIEYCKQANIHGITPEFAEFVVHLYRDTFQGVAKFWRQATKGVDGLLKGVDGYPLPNTNPVVWTARDPIFNQPSIVLPNGLHIKYPGLNKDGNGDVTYLDGAKFVKLFGGKTTENIVQALAALVMRMQKRELSKFYRVVMTTHDELVALIPEDHGDEHEWSEKKQMWKKTGDGIFSKKAIEIMTKPIDFLPGLPLAIESDTAYTYGDAH